MRLPEYSESTMTEWVPPTDAFLGNQCQYVVRAFRYRKPAICGYNAESHSVADLGHPFKARP